MQNSEVEMAKLLTSAAVGQVHAREPADCATKHDADA